MQLATKWKFRIFFRKTICTSSTNFEIVFGEFYQTYLRMKIKHYFYKYFILEVRSFEIDHQNSFCKFYELETHVILISDVNLFLCCNWYKIAVFCCRKSIFKISKTEISWSDQAKKSVKCTIMVNWIKNLLSSWRN